MEIISALLAICAGNSPVPGEFPAQRPVTPSFDVFFDLRLNKRLSKQTWGWWFETPPRPLWRHSNAAGKSPYGMTMMGNRSIVRHGATQNYHLLTRAYLIHIAINRGKVTHLLTKILELDLQSCNTRLLNKGRFWAELVRSQIIISCTQIPRLSIKLILIMHKCMGANSKPTCVPLINRDQLLW